MTLIAITLIKIRKVDQHIGVSQPAPPHLSPVSSHHTFGGFRGRGGGARGRGSGGDVSFPISSRLTMLFWTFRKRSDLSDSFWHASCKIWYNFNPTGWHVEHGRGVAGGPRRSTLRWHLLSQVSQNIKNGKNVLRKKMNLPPLDLKWDKPCVGICYMQRVRGVGFE